MKKLVALKILLFVSGVIGMLVGGGMLFFPVDFHASAGVIVNGGINLNNEMRAAGGPLLVGGLIIAAGAFVKRLAFTSTIFAASLYLSYGVARVFSIVIDGVPSDALVKITGFELVIGALSLLALYYSQKNSENSSAHTV